MKTITLISNKNAKKKLKDYNVSSWAKQLVDQVELTDGIQYEVVIIPGSEFSDEERTTSNIRKYAAKKGYTTPPAEVGILLRLQLTDEEINAMGLWWIVIMHEPIKDSDGGPCLLGAYRNDDGRWLSAYYVKPDRRCSREYGFAFVVSQASTTTNFLEDWPEDKNPQYWKENEVLILEIKDVVVPQPTKYRI